MTNRCPECRKPVLRGQASHSVEHPAGTRAGLVHRMVTSTWHSGCWADAEAFAARSRRDAHERRVADIRAMFADHLPADELEARLADFRTQFEAEESARLVGA